MKNTLFLLLVLFAACSSSKKGIYDVSLADQLVSNQELNDFEKEKLRLGINEYDKGNYEVAQNYYQKILENKPYSSEALHELVLTLNTAGNFKESITYAKQGQQIDSEFRATFYHMQGVNLDYLGKPEHAIKAFKNGISVNDSIHFIHYSLAITSLNQGYVEQSIASLENSLMTNFEHASSHYLLGNIYFSRGSNIPSLLAYTYFLMYEPDSERSQIAFERIEQIFDSAVKDEKTNQINVGVSLFGSMGSEFSSQEMMLGILSASRYLEENKDLSEIEHIVNGYEMLLSLFSKNSEEEVPKTFMNQNYLPYLLEVHKDGYSETLTYLIFETSLLENVSTWINDNWETCEEFYAWIPFEEEEVKE